MTEKDRFQELLADLCRGIVEPPKKPFGRPATKSAIELGIDSKFWPSKEDQQEPVTLKSTPKAGAAL